MPVCQDNLCRAQKNGAPFPMRRIKFSPPTKRAISRVINLPDASVGVS
ncbi:MAG: hypothetical protein FWD58_04755 [Firmicutes bacterium]|nr:hypothetical protein [Bacillota bacterium]